LSKFGSPRDRNTLLVPGLFKKLAKDVASDPAVPVTGSVAAKAPSFIGTCRVLQNSSFMKRPMA